MDANYYKTISPGGKGICAYCGKTAELHKWSMGYGFCSQSCEYDWKKNSPDSPYREQGSSSSGSGKPAASASHETAEDSSDSGELSRIEAYVERQLNTRKMENCTNCGQPCSDGYWTNIPIICSKNCWDEFERKATAYANPTDADEQYALAVKYDDGDGVPKDLGSAAYWCIKAAEQGNARAQGWAGRLYFKGEGVPKDMYTSATWYRKAAEQGMVIAQSQFGWFCKYGIGVSKDLKEARIWLTKAAEQGDENAKKELKGMGFFAAFAESKPKAPANNPLEEMAGAYKKTLGEMTGVFKGLFKR